MPAEQPTPNPSRTAIVKYLMSVTGLCFAAADATLEEMIRAGEVVETEEGEMEVVG